LSGLQTPKLLDDQGQEEASAPGIKEILPILPKTHGPQGSQVIKVGL
jgi:hypothetical protein